MFFLLFLTLNLFASDITHNKVLARYTHPTGFEIKKASVDKFSYWKSRPDVRICTHAPVTIQRVKEALTCWKKRGYSFGYVYKSSCVTESDYGSIIIDLAGQEFDFEKSYPHRRINITLLYD